MTNKSANKSQDVIIMQYYVLVPACTGVCSTLATRNSTSAKCKDEVAPITLENIMPTYYGPSRIHGAALEGGAA